MGLHPKLLPPNVLRCMTKDETKKLGYVSPQQAKAKSDAKLEKELHEQVANLLRLRGVLYIGHSRMDRKSTRRVGEPDFLFSWWTGMLSKPCAIELKRPGGELSKEQRACIADMEEDGWEVLVATTLEQVKDWLDSL